MHFDFFVLDDSVATYDVHRKTTFFRGASVDSLSLAQFSIFCNENSEKYSSNVALYENSLNKLTLSVFPKKFLKTCLFHRINLTPPPPPLLSHGRLMIALMLPCNLPLVIYPSVWKLIVLTGGNPKDLNVWTVWRYRRLVKKADIANFYRSRIYFTGWRVDNAKFRKSDHRHSFLPYYSIIISITRPLSVIVETIERVLPFYLSLPLLYTYNSWQSHSYIFEFSFFGWDRSLEAHCGMSYDYCHTTSLFYFHILLTFIIVYSCSCFGKEIAWYFSVYAHSRYVEDQKETCHSLS